MRVKLKVKVKVKVRVKVKVKIKEKVNVNVKVKIKEKVKVRVKVRVKVKVKVNVRVKVKVKIKEKVKVRVKVKLKVKVRVKVKIKEKVKFTLEQATKTQTGSYSSTLSLASALDGVGGQCHCPATLPPGRDPVPVVQEAEWAPGPVWTGAENLAPTGIRSPDRPARSESLYRLSYPGPQFCHCTDYVIAIIFRSRKYGKFIAADTFETCND